MAGLKRSLLVLYAAITSLVSFFGSQPTYYLAQPPAAESPRYTLAELQQRHPGSVFIMPS